MEIKFISTQPLKGVAKATINELLQFIEQHSHLGVDTETTGLHPILHDVLLLQIGDDDVAYVVDCRTTPFDEVCVVLEQLAKKTCVLQNAKFDQKFLYQRYGVMLYKIFDTRLASQLLNAGLGMSNSLAAILKREMDVDMDKQARNSFIGKSAHEPFTLEEVTYAGKDTLYLLELSRILFRKLSKKGMLRLASIEFQLSAVLSKIELKGIDMDVDKWKALAARAESRLRWLEQLMDREIRRLSESYDELLGGKYTRKRVHHAVVQKDLFSTDYDTTIASPNDGNINYASSTQIKELFARVGLDLVDENNKPSAKEAVLRDMLHSNKAPEFNRFLEFLLQHREYGKRISTYGESFLKFINPKTGRIHTRFNQCATATGRLSSGDDTDEKGKGLGYYVNFQNIPKVQDYRSCFTVPSPDYKFITYDLSGAELCILASNSQDPLLIASRTEGADLHSILATKSYQIITGDPDFEVSSTKNSHLRQRHKSVIFGIAYGAGARRVAEILDVDESTAGKVLNGIYERLPTMRNYLDKTKQAAVSNGYVLSNPRTRRRRSFTEEMIATKAWKVEKEACNMPIQATNADMIKEALVMIDKRLHSVDAWIVNTVHDEISVVAHKDVAEQVSRIVRESMIATANEYLDGVEMEVDGKIDNYWIK